MSQIIQQRKGSLSNIGSLQVYQGEVIMGTGSISNLNGPVVFIGSGSKYYPIAQIYSGSTAPSISAYPHLQGLLFYETGSKNLYILQSGSNLLLTPNSNLIAGSGIDYNISTGVISNKLTTGTGSNQTVIGSTLANGTLTFIGNNASSGNTTTAAIPNMQFKVGDSGNVLAMSIQNNGKIWVGPITPDANALGYVTVRINAVNGTSNLLKLQNELTSNGGFSDIQMNAGGSSANITLFNQNTSATVFAASSLRISNVSGDIHLQSFPGAGSGNIRLTTGGFTTAEQRYWITGGGRSIWNSNTDLGFQYQFSGNMIIVNTAEQIRTAYDTSNYMTTTIGSTGLATFTLTGSAAVTSFTFNSIISASLGIVIPANRSIVMGTSTGISMGAGSGISINVGSSTIYIGTYANSIGLPTFDKSGIGWSTFGDNVQNADVFLWHPAAGTIALTGGKSIPNQAQTFQIYGKLDSVTTFANYERLSITHTGSLISISSQAAGTGVVGDINFKGAPQIIIDGSIRISGSSGPSWTAGSGSPEGVVTAPTGSLYSNKGGGSITTLYVKESGNGNTGWVPK
jgi:hypothetical protein